MSKILKTVGKYKITEDDLAQFIAGLSREQQAYASMPQFREQCVEHLAETYLFAMAGEDEKLDETEDYKRVMEAARRDLLSQLAINKTLQGLTVSDDEAASFYAKNLGQFKKGPSASAKHILVDTEEKAESLKKEIEAGFLTFERAARENSTCPSREKGGDLGTFTQGQMVPEFDQVVFSGEIGKLLGPVKTQFGYHLIKIESRQEAGQQTFEEAKDMIKKALLGEKQRKAYNDKVESLKRKYDGPHILLS